MGPLTGVRVVELTGIGPGPFAGIEPPRRGGALYRTYACADGRFVAVGAIEPAFYAELLDHLGLDPDGWQNDRDRWPAQRAALARIFATRPRDEWAAHFEGSDACVAPVLSLTEAPTHPLLAARGLGPTDRPPFHWAHNWRSPLTGGG